MASILSRPQYVNSLAPERRDSNFKLVIPTHMVCIKFVNNSCEVVSPLMPPHTFDDKPTLIPVMDQCCQATCPYLSQCWVTSMLPCDITRPQWVNHQIRAAAGNMCNFIQIRAINTVWLTKLALTDIWIKINAYYLSRMQPSSWSMQGWIKTFLAALRWQKTYKW